LESKYWRYNTWCQRGVCCNFSAVSNCGHHL